MEDMDNFENSTVLVSGDWHADSQHAERVIRAAVKKNIKVIIQVGDLGILWPSAGGPQTESKFTTLLVRWLAEAGITLIFIDGNHDVHPRLRSLQLNSAGFGVISEHILYSPRGHRFTLGGKRFGSLGGAVSIDKSMRVAGRTWWPEEEITLDDVELLGYEPVDVLLTHEVSTEVRVESGLIFPLAEELALATYQQRRLVRDAIRNTTPRLVFSGHWHQSVTHQLSGTQTTVHVLDMNSYPGNCVELDLASLNVTPFPIFKPNPFL